MNGEVCWVGTEWTNCMRKKERKNCVKRRLGGHGQRVGRQIMAFEIYEEEKYKRRAEKKDRTRIKKKRKRMDME